MQLNRTSARLLERAFVLPNFANREDIQAHVNGINEEFIQGRQQAIKKCIPHTRPRRLSEEDHVLCQLQQTHRYISTFLKRTSHHVQLTKGILTPVKVAKSLDKIQESLLANQLCEATEDIHKLYDEKINYRQYLRQRLKDIEARIEIRRLHLTVDKIRQLTEQRNINMATPSEMKRALKSMLNK